MTKVVLLDNGHGINTPGKKSPDGRILEWKYTRELAKALKPLFQERGYTVELVTPEDMDISLSTRVKRINEYCRKYGAKNCVMISLHCNAAGNGPWMTGTGWEVWTTRGTTISDKLATFLFNSARKNCEGKKMRADFSDGDPDKENNWAVIKGANCAAVLTENFFMDSKSDVEYMLSDKGFKAILATHVEGVVNYFNSLK